MIDQLIGDNVAHISSQFDICNSISSLIDCGMRLYATLFSLVNTSCLTDTDNFFGDLIGKLVYFIGEHDSRSFLLVIGILITLAQNCFCMRCIQLRYGSLMGETKAIVMS